MKREATRWQRLELPLSEDARELGPGFELWFAEFDTREEPDEWREFLYDPLQQLKEAGILDDERWRLSTLIVNHHKPLNPRIGLASVSVSHDDHDAGLTIYKPEE